MKQRTQGVLAGMLVASVLFGAVPAMAANAEVLFNKVNISLNGNTIAEAGGNTVLESGLEIPNSITFKDTTYLPIRRMTELLKKDISWDGNTQTVDVKDFERNGCQSLSDTLIKHYPMAVGQELKEDVIKTMFTLDLDKVKEYSITVPFINIKTTEVVILEMKDAKDVADAKTALKKRQADVVKSFENYLQDQKELAQNAVIGSEGNYVYMFIHEEAASMEETLKTLIK